MAFTRNTSATNTISNQPNLVKGQAATLKAAFDKVAVDNKAFENALLAELESTTAGSSGAENIGSAPISGVTGTTIYGQVSDLKTQINTDAAELATHKTSSDHDGRYYTESELNSGQLDNRYYTEAELNNGQLDTRYYTETEANAIDSANVKLTGNQTIADVKTFTSSPIVPAPTTASQASTKKYVDDSIGSVVLGQIPDNSLTNAKLGSDIKIGSTAALTTTSKEVVGAINELDADLGSVTTQLADISSQATNKGASLVGINDSEGRYAATTVEGALAEVDARQNGRVLKNWIINGGFDVWQRGVLQTIVGYGSDDRWLNENGTTLKTHTKEIFSVGQNIVPNNPINFSRTTFTSANTSSSYVVKSQKIEDVSKLAGKTISISFWAKADASKNIALEFRQLFGSGGSADVSSIGSQKIALSTSWQRFTRTVSIPSVSGKTIGLGSSLQCIFWLEAGSDFNARTSSLGNQSGTFDIANVSLVEGSVAQEWQTEAYGDVLRQCQRYYEKSYSIDVVPGTIAEAGSIVDLQTRNNASYTAGTMFMVSKRIPPTVVLYSPYTGTPSKVSNNGDKTATVSSISTERFKYISIASGDSTYESSFQYTADAEL